MFTGVYTALITPFLRDGSLDEKAFKALIEYNIANGVSGLVPCGTTGESPTLSHKEHARVIELTVAQAAGRVPVLAGTGSNSTEEAMLLSQEAEQLGVNAVLLVNPYYNKPTQEGLYRHFKAIAASLTIPVVLYNIKGRTGVNLETDTLLRLITDCPNIRGVKEASGDLLQMEEVLKRVPRDFSVLSGDDNLTLDLITRGGHGVVSVASNIAPKKMSALVSAARTGDWKTAKTLHEELAPLFEAEFIETNPIPIKYLCSKKGLCEEVYRLPLCELSKNHRTEVDRLTQVLALT